MLLLAHLGYTVGGGWIAQSLRLKNAIDFRLVAFMAIFPDVLDRALYLLFIPDAVSGRLIAHTLIFQLALFAALVIMRRSFWIYGLASLMHLALDSRGLLAAQALWPLLGADLENIHIVSGSAAAAGHSFGERLMDRLEVITSTYTNADLSAILFDIGGLVTLLVLALGAGLYKPGRLLWLARRGRTVASAEDASSDPHGRRLPYPPRSGK